MSDVFDPSNYEVADGGAIETTYDAATADGTFTADDGYATATAAEHEQTDAWNLESKLDLAQGEAWQAGDTDAYYALGEAEADAHQYGQEAYSAEVDATYSDYDADTSTYDTSAYDTSTVDTSTTYDASTYDTSSSDTSTYDTSTYDDSSSSYDDGY